MACAPIWGLEIKVKRKLDITILEKMCPFPLIPLCREQLAKRNYSAALLMLAKRDRLDGFQALADYLPDRQYWRLLGEVWTDAERPSHRQHEWLRLFRSRRPGRTLLMNAAERRVFVKLPEVVRVYRASTESAVRGMAWTLDIDVAKFFHGYYGGLGITCQIWTAEIEKRHIFAFLEYRKEKEVVLDPRQLHNISLVGMTETAAA